MYSKHGISQHNVRLYGVFKDERDEDESVVGIISVFFADVDHRAVISRAGASDSSATPVMKARPRLPLCLSNYCAAAEGSFFILQEPWGDSTTLFADFGLFARASLSFFFSFWVSSFCTARRFNFDQGFQRSRSEASLFVHCVNMMSSGFSLSIFTVLRIFTNV